MKETIKARLKASGVHLSFSAFIIGLYLAALLLIWYPGPYFALESTWEVILILVAVDLVLGPLLTFIIFNTAKPRGELVRDLGVIVTVQLVALAWGVHTTYTARPVYLAFATGIFYSVGENDIDVAAIADDDLRVGPWDRPKPVYVRPPESAEERSKLIAGLAYGTGRDLPYLPARYADFKSNLVKVLPASRNIQATIEGKPEKEQKLAEFLRAAGGKPDDYGFFSVFGRKKEGVIVVKRDSGDIVGYIDMPL